jgi:hypothetical protein
MAVGVPANVPLAAWSSPSPPAMCRSPRDLDAHGPFDVLGAALGALGLAGVTYALITPERMASVTRPSW